MDKTNDGNAKPNGCGLLVIAAFVIVTIIGLVIIANYLSTLAGIH